MDRFPSSQVSYGVSSFWLGVQRLNRLMSATTSSDASGENIPVSIVEVDDNTQSASA